MLVDSEAPVACGVSGWEHVRSIDNWTKPEQVTDKQLHLMVQCMESWFLSDKSCLQAFYGQELNTDVLPGSSEVEEIAKNDVLVGLQEATRQCRRKGQYSKRRHSFKILAELDPTRVTQASQHAKRLIEFMKSHTRIQQS